MVYGCQSGATDAELAVPNVSYPETMLPTDTTELWVEDGTPSSDTVLLICQGGPSNVLTFEAEGRTSYRYLPGYANYRIAYVHQAQTFNKALFEHQGPFTEADATAEVDRTVEMLHRSVRYFEQRGKTTMVIGTSYGAYVTARLLASKPNQADKYILIAGRLDDDPRMVEHHLSGKNASFQADGTSFVPQDSSLSSDMEHAQADSGYRIKQLLKGAIGKPRYTRLLADKDLSNLSFFYAVNDQHVGRPAEAELAFLASKDAALYPTSSGHSETLYRFIDHVMDGRFKL